MKELRWLAAILVLGGLAACDEPATLDDACGRMCSCARADGECIAYCVRPRTTEGIPQACLDCIVGAPTCDLFERCEATCATLDGDGNFFCTETLCARGTSLVCCPGPTPGYWNTSLERCLC